MKKAIERNAKRARTLLTVEILIFFMLIGRNIRYRSCLYMCTHCCALKCVNNHKMQSKWRDELKANIMQFPIVVKRGRLEKKRPPKWKIQMCMCYINLFNQSKAIEKKNRNSRTTGKKRAHIRFRWIKMILLQFCFCIQLKCLNEMKIQKKIYQFEHTYEKYIYIQYKCKFINLLKSQTNRNETQKKMNGEFNYITNNGPKHHRKLSCCWL